MRSSPMYMSDVAVTVNIHTEGSQALVLVEQGRVAG